jgi:hypothetical protein
MAQFSGMSRLFSRKLALLVAVAAVLAGGAIAAVDATSGSPSKPVRLNASNHASDVSDTQTTVGRRARPRLHRGIPRALIAATNYLGVTVKQLRHDLRAGRSLAQIANDTPGKSEAGLINAIEVAQGSKLAAAAQRLSRRITSQVRSPGGPAAARARIHGLRSAARTYLGLSAAQLLSDSRAGRSLAQIAQATAGKSEAGLVEALTSARRLQVEAVAKTGRLSASEESTRLAAARQRIDAYVHRVPRIRATGRRTRKAAAASY